MSKQVNHIYKYEVSNDGKTWIELDSPAGFQEYRYDRTTHTEDYPRDWSKQQAELRETYRRLDEMTETVVLQRSTIKELRDFVGELEARCRAYNGKR